ncbi:MAG: putative Fe-S cluster assembly protein SufT [Gammaproteobacteria bacterium]|nr:putative Fe-S cluster assembly protein SufT [Gammaproteobacteria bacterium]
MTEREPIALKRDCEVRIIPLGTLVTLKKGMNVIVTQSLGGSFTIEAEGSLFRVDNQDADALGKEPVQTPSSQDCELTVEGILEHLKTCYDPEIPVNIVDLGLIYSCELIPCPEGSVRVVIVMTLTAPGCGMGPVLVEEIERKVKNISGVQEVTVQLVFEPPWDQSRLSEVAKIQLGLC